MSSSSSIFPPDAQPERASFGYRVADAISAAMDAAAYTPSSLSKASGVPRTTLLRRLNGGSVFTVAEFYAVTAVLGISASDLLNAALSAAQEFDLAHLQSAD